VGVTIDFSSYKDWLAQHPEHEAPNILPDEFRSPVAAVADATTSRDFRQENQEAAAPDSAASKARHHQAAMMDLSSEMKILSTAETTEPAPQGAAALAWQRAAPRADLYVDRRHMPQADGAGSGDSADEPNYPLGFAQMLEMLQKGIPIPGIREIPDTVARDPVSVSLG
jgi:hypothetical protein